MREAQRLAIHAVIGAVVVPIVVHDRVRAHGGRALRPDVLFPSLNDMGELRLEIDDHLAPERRVAHFERLAGGGDEIGLRVGLD